MWHLIESMTKLKGFAITVGTLAAAGVGIAAILAQMSERSPGSGPNGLLFPVPEDLYPFAHHFLDLPNGANIHYIDEGPPDATRILVFLHGNPTWSFLYRHIIIALRSTYRCIAMDYPGFGLSTAPPGYDYRPRGQSTSVEDFIERLNLGRVTFMMQDWGGPIGFGVAGRRPEWIDRLIVGNTWAWPSDGDAKKERFSRLMGGPFGQFLGTNFNGIVHMFLRGGTSRRLSPREFEMYLRPFRQKSRRRPTIILPAEIVGSRPYLQDVERGLAKIVDRPMLILWGTADKVYRPEDRERFEKIFPNHKTVLLRGANHYIQEDAPEAICTAIRQFLG